MSWCLELISERYRLESGKAFVFERHLVPAEIVVFVNIRGHVERRFDSYLEVVDAVGMVLQDSVYNRQGVHLRNDSHRPMVERFVTYRPVKTAGHLVGRKFLFGHYLNGRRAAYLGEQVHGGREDVGYIPVSDSVVGLRVVFDVDHPNVDRAHAAEVPQLHGLIKTFGVVIVYGFWVAAHGCNMQMIARAPCTYKFLVIGHGIIGC